jgi:hypothetical protein
MVVSKLSTQLWNPTIVLLPAFFFLFGRFTGVGIILFWLNRLIMGYYGKDLFDKFRFRNYDWKAIRADNPNCREENQDEAS